LVCPCHYTGADLTPEQPLVTNRLAVLLGIFILIAVAVDVVLNGTENLLFLSKKFLELIEWIAFWR